MLLCVHAGLGALAGSFLPGSASAVLFGLGSHAALDAIRHEDNCSALGQGNTLASVADALLTFGFLAALASKGGRSRATLCAAAGALPDLEMLLPWNSHSSRNPRWLFPSHAIPALHSTVCPASISLRSQLLLALCCWGVVLAGQRSTGEAIDG